MNRKLIICLALFALSTLQAGGVTFVNANTTNTFGYDDSNDWWTDSNNTPDDKWRHRTGFGMGDGDLLPATPNDVVDGNEIYQSIDSGQTGKDARTLKTTITGLNANERYYIYTYFWSDEWNSPWSIRTALTQAGLATNLFTGGSSPSGPTTPVQVGLDSAGRKLWQVYIGTVTGVTEQLVWIDDLPTDDSNYRTWYDGVGYEKVNTITFVNADSTNTTRADGNDDWWNTAGWDGTPHWRYRTGFGMGDGDSLPASPNDVVDEDEIYQSIDSGESGTDAYTLKTTITGLNANETYYIYTYFWSDEAGSPWSIRTALTQAGLADANYSPYTGNATQVGLDSANRVLWQVYLGTVTGVTEQAVWIDDLPTDDSNYRTWYDGVGYEKVNTITFVNANTTNTFGYDDSNDWWTDSNNTPDDKWRHRTGYGMLEGDLLPASPDGVVLGGEIYQSIDSGQTGKNARTLKTTITGLDANETYCIYTYFWSDEAGSPWRIRTALTQAGLATNLFIGGDTPTGPKTPVQVGLDSAGRKMWQVCLGIVNGVTEQAVWIGDLPTNDSNRRTWYDGVGYKSVPCTFVYRYKSTKWYYDYDSNDSNWVNSRGPEQGYFIIDGYGQAALLDTNRRSLSYQKVYDGNFSTTMEQMFGQTRDTWLFSQFGNDYNDFSLVVYGGARTRTIAGTAVEVASSLRGTSINNFGSDPRYIEMGKVNLKLNLAWTTLSIGNQWSCTQALAAIEADLNDVGYTEFTDLTELVSDSNYYDLVTPDVNVLVYNCSERGYEYSDPNSLWTRTRVNNRFFLVIDVNSGQYTRIDYDPRARTYEETMSGTYQVLGIQGVRRTWWVALDLDSDSALALRGGTQTRRLGTQWVSVASKLRGYSTYDQGTSPQYIGDKTINCTLHSILSAEALEGGYTLSQAVDAVKAFLDSKIYTEL